MSDSSYGPTPYYRELPLDEQGHVLIDLNCLSCGYNLRGLSPDGRCPECGIAVGKSAYGDLLGYCEPTWVESLASGMNWIVAYLAMTIIGLVGMFFLGVALQPGQSDASMMILVFAGGVGLIEIVGYWKLTTPEPSRLSEPTVLSPPTVARYGRITALVVGLAALAVLLNSTSKDSTRLGLVAYLVGEMAGIAALVALLMHVSTLAARVPDERLARHTRNVMYGLSTAWFFSFIGRVLDTAQVWGGPNMATPLSPALDTLSTTATCLTGLLWLIFGIWGLLLIFRYRRAFATVSHQARTTWASEPASYRTEQGDSWRQPFA